MHKNLGRQGVGSLLRRFAIEEAAAEPIDGVLPDRIVVRSRAELLAKVLGTTAAMATNWGKGHRIE